MVQCPVCKSMCFDDMEVCYGCMHRFETGFTLAGDFAPSGLPAFEVEEPNAVAVPQVQSEGATAPLPVSPAAASSGTAAPHDAVHHETMIASPIAAVGSTPSASALAEPAAAQAFPSPHMAADAVPTTPSTPLSFSFPVDGQAYNLVISVQPVKTHNVAADDEAAQSVQLAATGGRHKEDDSDLPLAAERDCDDIEAHAVEVEPSFLPTSFADDVELFDALFFHESNPEPLSVEALAYA